MCFQTDRVLRKTGKITDFPKDPLKNLFADFNKFPQRCLITPQAILAPAFPDGCV